MSHNFIGMCLSTPLFTYCYSYKETVRKDTHMSAAVTLAMSVFAVVVAFALYISDAFQQ
jgi:hypothetical protein